MMNVEKSQVTKLKITGADRLDPIAVILEDLEPRKGKIIIECYGQSWSSYWGGMGDQTISEFFISCNQHYIAGNLAPQLNSDESDWEAFPAHLRKEIIKLRRDGELNKEDAAELWERFEDGCVCDDAHQAWGERNWNEIVKVVGDDWWHCVPTKPNHDYQYLCRIICAVQEGLKQVNDQTTAAPRAHRGSDD